MTQFIERLYTLVCFFFILLFCYAAISKIMDFETFQVQITQSPLLNIISGLVSYGILAVELVICGLLIFERSRLLGLYASFTLMVLFTFYIYIILHYSEFVPCSCGGILEKMDWNTHMVFNIVCVIIAGVVLIVKTKISGHRIIKPAILLLLISMLCGISLVLLYQRSEYMLVKENNFTRRLLKHPFDLEKKYNLELDSYYFAGSSEDSIYLGNSNTPFVYYSIDAKLNYLKQHPVIPDQFNFEFKSPRIKVTHPNFYFFDGTVPVIYHGIVGKEKMRTISFQQSYFLQLQPMRKDHFAMIGYSKKEDIQSLGLLSTGSYPSSLLKPNLLEKINDGIFDTDGKLLFDETAEKLVYVYNYRNQFIVADQQLEHSHTFQTIDNLQFQKLEVTHLSDGSKKMKNPSTTVNKNAFVYKGVLFIGSPRMGKSEDKKQWKKSISIDMYAISEQKYLGSFYLPKISESSMTGLMVSNNTLFTIIGNELIRYRLAQNITQHFIQGKPKT
ncbi:MauE/DoxX family redox-associated membrane protein [Chryseobacterium sp. CFS15]|uniref:MauE/DoxX family redox-associated membrane protein n=1 Tax=Chryseobacterium sp. CFS15 TaxID=2986946 RepID=UPI0028081F88|nr:MauE/DoxX family redox-associated membrane protein [Chryseobacterium sp. CFS15]MDQ8141478.1 tellurium resistance protein TerC [Chryseobacterium sp. CFS15]